VNRTVVATVMVTVMVGAATACPFLPDHQLERAGDVFIAQSADFGGYRDWPSVVVATTPDASGHNAAPRTVYVSQLPAEGATEWPVGTVLVKEGSGLEASGQTGTQTHAMVKRGGSFNVQGARGWEWFEVGITTTNTVAIQWRGERPPDGESYGCLIADCSGAQSLVCNDCHGAADNDHVLSEPLQLSALAQTVFTQ
jgi:hypothetical protein